MGSRRYGISLRVFNFISHEWVQRTSEILGWTRPPYIILMTTFLTISKDLRRFSKIVPKARRTFPNIFRTFPNILRRLLRIPEEDRGRSEDVKIIHQQIYLILLPKMLSSHVRISYLHMWWYHIYRFWVIFFVKIPWSHQSDWSYY